MPLARRLALLTVLALALPVSTAENKLRAWLGDMGEGAHAGAFEAEGFSTVEELVSTGLEEADLAELGLGLKARRRIAKALRSLANQGQTQTTHSSPLVDSTTRTHRSLSLSLFLSLSLSLFMALRLLWQ